MLTRWISLTCVLGISAVTIWGVCGQFSLLRREFEVGDWKLFPSRMAFSLSALRPRRSLEEIPLLTPNCGGNSLLLLLVKNEIETSAGRQSFISFAKKRSINMWTVRMKKDPEQGENWTFYACGETHPRGVFCILRVSPLPKGVYSRPFVSCRYWYRPRLDITVQNTKDLDIGEEGEEVGSLKRIWILMRKQKGTMSHVVEMQSNWINNYNQRV